MSTNQLTMCERHPEEEVRLTCGECRRQICTVCLTLTGEGPRCEECMARLNRGFTIPGLVEGEVIPAGEEAARQDAARSAYYATEKVVYCARHPQIETGLRCGRCDTPICPRCMIHGAVGIRCPDCAANPQRTIGLKVEQEAATKDQAPRATGFRNYWHNNQAYQKVTPRHYLLALLAGIGAAILIGFAWGMLMDGNLRRSLGRSLFSEAQLMLPDAQGASGLSRLISMSIQSSIHLLPEIALGVIVAEVIARVTGNRVGRGLQVIGGLAVAAGILTATLTVGARIFQNATGQFPSFDQVLTASFSAIGQQFNGSGVGILIFWAIGIAFAVVRLKR